MRVLAWLLIPCSLFVYWRSGLAQTAQPQFDRTAEAIRSLEHYRETMIPTYMSDFGQLGRYRAADAALGAPKPGEPRVVFFGDSITDAWHLDEYFPGKGYINRGISGQTTPQMLVRFHQDVIGVQAAVVVILAGTNDIAGNTGPMSIAETEANYEALAELARAHGIRVVFSSVLPVHDYTPQSQNFFVQRSPAKILDLNEWLKDYCAKNALIYLDYFSATVNEEGLLKKDLSLDGLHPDEAGYKIMAPLAEAAIAKALAER
jgi:lysophospholipase L1-like esterase